MDIVLAETEAPVKLIVFAIFGAIWLLTAIFGKKTPTPIVPTTQRRTTPTPTPRGPQRQTPAPPPPPMPAKQRGKAKRQTATIAQAAQLARQAAQQAKPAVVNQTIVALTPPRAKSETARNLRLMLQRGGVREAFLLSEILSAPKSMRE